MRGWRTPGVSGLGDATVFLERGEGSPWLPTSDMVQAIVGPCCSLGLFVLVRFHSCLVWLFGGSHPGL